MTFRTDLEALVLAAVQDRPLHGYGIVRTIRERSHGVFRLGEGQLYPILHRMEEKGWTAGHWEPQDGKPPRKVYSLTPMGREELRARRQSWDLFAEAVDSVLCGRK